MKATEFLKRQSAAIRSLLERAQAGRRGAMQELSRVLTAQLAAERQLCYPAVLHLAESEVIEAWEKQGEAERALRRVLSARAVSDGAESQLAELRARVITLAESEERRLVPQLENKLSSERQESLGAAMEARFMAVFRKLWARCYLRPARKQRVAELTRIARARNTPRRWLAERRSHLARALRFPVLTTRSSLLPIG